MALQWKGPNKANCLLTIPICSAAEAQEWHKGWQWYLQWAKAKGTTAGGVICHCQDQWGQLGGKGPLGHPLHEAELGTEGVQYGK